VLLAREHPRKRRKTIWNRFCASCGAGRDRWLFPNHELQLGNEVDDELAIGLSASFGTRAIAKLDLAPAQERADKALDRLAQGGVRMSRFVLIELARGEQAARRTSALCSSLTTRNLPMPE